MGELHYKYAEAIAERIEAPLKHLAAIMRATVDAYECTEAERDITPKDAEMLAGYMEAFTAWCDAIYEEARTLANNAERAYLKEAQQGDNSPSQPRVDGE